MCEEDKGRIVNSSQRVIERKRGIKAINWDCDSVKMQVLIKIK